MAAVLSTAEKLYAIGKFDVTDGVGDGVTERPLVGDGEADCDRDAEDDGDGDTERDGID